jgi:hypothetical protein
MTAFKVPFMGSRLSSDAAADRFGAPVLARVPEMLTATERRRNRRARLALLLTFVAGGCAAAGAAAWLLFG